MRDAFVEVPKIAPLHLLSHPVPSLDAMALRNNSSLEQLSLAAERRAHIHDGVSVLSDDWSDDSRPEKRLFDGSFGFSLAHQLDVGCGLILLDNQIREFFVDYVLLLGLLWEDRRREFLGQLTEVAPEVRVCCHRTLSMVRTRAHDRRFFS